MKIKLLLAALCLLCGMQPAAYGQQTEDNGQLSIHDSQLITHNSELHRVPPRKEIRHKVNSQWPTHNSQPTSHNSELLTRASGEYIMTEFPTTGEIKGIVILAAFADVPFSISSDSINKLLRGRYNADNYTEEIKFNEYSEVYGQYCPLEATIPGSARDYFRAQSFGQFVPQFDVIGPVTLDSIRAYYGANNSSGKDKNTAGMIRDACRKAYSMGLTDFTDYDNDNDSIADVVYVVYAGSDEAQTGFEECIWAKASKISFTLGNGMKIERYACSSELVIDLPVVSGIGTFVHEFSHVLGLPDFYNTKDEDFTMDVWSVMDYGMYNAEGFVPCGYTAFERYSLGWTSMHTLNAPATLSIGTTDEERRGYRIFTSDIDSTSLITPADTASFYVLETIRKEGWNRYAPANGLLISEVTYDASAWKNNSVNVGKHRHCIVPANNDYSFKTANKHLFGVVVPSKQSTDQDFINQTFTLTSTPASRTQFGAAMDKPLTDIRYDEQTGKTSFHFCGGNIENSIESPSTLNPQLSTQTYDLQGRPVITPTSGLYIKDRKKVVTK